MDAAFPDGRYRFRFNTSHGHRTNQNVTLQRSRLAAATRMSTTFPPPFAVTGQQRGKVVSPLVHIKPLPPPTLPRHISALATQGTVAQTYFLRAVTGRTLPN